MLNASAGVSNVECATGGPIPINSSCVYTRLGTAFCPRVGVKFDPTSTVRHFSVVAFVGDLVDVETLSQHFARAKFVPGQPGLTDRVGERRCRRDAVGVFTAQQFGRLLGFQPPSEPTHPPDERP